MLEGDGRLLFKYIHTDGVCWEGDLLNATKNVPVVFSKKEEGFSLDTIKDKLKTVSS